MRGTRVVFRLSQLVTQIGFLLPSPTITGVIPRGKPLGTHPRVIGRTTGVDPSSDATVEETSVIVLTQVMI